MNKKAVVVIPIYKEVISDDEMISLEQCCGVLSQYPIVFVCSHLLCTEIYEQIVNKSGISFCKETFDDNYFHSIKSYNSLCLSPAFYRRFVQYEYMLLYQLDAFVFRDELMQWMTEGYDYVGAPWYSDRKSTRKPDDQVFLFGVGNGGFSLRRIAVLSNFFRFPIFPFYHLKTVVLRKEKLLLSLLELIHAYYLYFFGKNEDIIFHTCGKAGLLNIPNEQKALCFAFDTHPALSLKLNEGIIPFGCHAWNKNKTFWTNYIQFNYPPTKLRNNDKISM